MLLLSLLLLAAGTPTPTELVERAIKVRQEQAQRGWKYTYREEVHRQLFEKDGPKPERLETYDVIMLEGENYRKLVLLNGQPLSAKRQKEVDAELEKTRSARRKRSLRTITRTVHTGGLPQLARLFDLTLAGEETINGRKTWRVEAQPKPNLQTADKRDQEALATSRTTWFDQETGLDLQFTNHFLRAVNGFQPGSELEVRFDPSGLLQQTRITYDLKAMAVVRLRGETRNVFSNYQRFQTESKMLP